MTSCLQMDFAALLKGEALSGNVSQKWRVHSNYMGVSPSTFKRCKPHDPHEGLRFWIRHWLEKTNPWQYCICFETRYFFWTQVKVPLGVKFPYMLVLNDPLKHGKQNCQPNGLRGCLTIWVHFNDLQSLNVTIKPTPKKIHWDDVEIILLPRVQSFYRRSKLVCNHLVASTHSFFRPQGEHVQSLRASTKRSRLR